MMVETCSACVGTCWLPPQSCACCSCPHMICPYVRKTCCVTLLSHHSFILGELLLWLDNDFLLLVESGGAQGEEVLGDLLLVLGGSPSLLEESSTSPKEWEDSCSSLLGLLEHGFSPWKVETWYPFLLSLASSSSLNKRLSAEEPGNILSH